MATTVQCPDPLDIVVDSTTGILYVACHGYNQDATDSRVISINIGVITTLAGGTHKGGAPAVRQAHLKP